MLSLFLAYAGPMGLLSALLDFLPNPVPSSPLVLGFCRTCPFSPSLTFLLVSLTFKGGATSPDPFSPSLFCFLPYFQ